ncbi:MAG TPA: DegT/DnrJ/EryC1/StrS family aminotransferase [Candidatus Competibacteraceae bacterium]|nr:DegT/DnrJ/EryC1/StrS family aminotransferase [Candidatus Competibacteraceae bacterium]
MIPFLDLKAQYDSIQDEILAAVSAALASTQFVLGKEVAAFEEEFAAYSGGKFGIGVNSGTSALHLALLAAGVKPGDEVITVSCTFVATVAAIDYAGARPVFVDVDPLTHNMDPAQVEAAITERTRVIMPVHLHGQPADLDPILEIARRHRLLVIEDAAQAHAAEYQGRRVGSIGDLGCFSFYPGKNLGAYGEGGMVVTNNEEFAHTIRMLRDWGQERKYHHVLKGFNYRMEGIQGAILRVKLRHLDAWTEARRRHAARYNALLAGVAVQKPVEMPYAKHVYHVYAIRTPRRDVLQESLQARDIQTGIHYPIPVHLQKAYANFGYGPGDLPVTEQASNELLSLPMFAELADQQIEAVCAAVREAA